MRSLLHLDALRSMSEAAKRVIINSETVPGRQNYLVTDYGTVALPNWVWPPAYYSAETGIDQGLHRACAEAWTSGTSVQEAADAYFLRRH